MDNLTKMTEWQSLLKHRQELEGVTLRDLFARDVKRFENFHIQGQGLLFDFSKNIITKNTLSHLINFAKATDLKSRIENLFIGKQVNNTEYRAALHTALRATNTKSIIVNQQNIMPEIVATMTKMASFCQQVHSKHYCGFTGKPITDIVNIGIGGSYLGPLLICDALSSQKIADIESHFIANIDSHEILQVLNKLNPETTLFIVSSKSFSTFETLTNADTAKQWFLSQTDDKDAFEKHFIAVTSNIHKALQKGFKNSQIFPIWDFIGGRFSVWSAVGLPIALSFGMDTLNELLAGAHAMDEHFKETEFNNNMPVIAALLGVWYNNFFANSAHVVLPYSQSLKYLPNYLQQLDMESNGKSVNIHGQAVDYQTATILFGQAGTLGQHAFYQLLHQGTHFVTSDFILPINTGEQAIEKHQAILAASCFSQSRALMHGKTYGEAYQELINQGMNKDQASQLARHKIIPGNKPSNTILMEKLSAFELGALLAFYEHKVFTQGVLWQINSFDQWGVELGKEIAKSIYHVMHDHLSSSEFDSSTQALIKNYQELTTRNKK